MNESFWQKLCRLTQYTMVAVWLRKRRKRKYDKQFLAGYNHAMRCMQVGMTPEAVFDRITADADFSGWGPYERGGQQAVYDEELIRAHGDKDESFGTTG
jgi:hypothetical protein